MGARGNGEPFRLSKLTAIYPALGSGRTLDMTYTAGWFESADGSVLNPNWKMHLYVYAGTPTLTTDESGNPSIDITGCTLLLHQNPATVQGWIQTGTNTYTIPLTSGNITTACNAFSTLNKIPISVVVAERNPSSRYTITYYMRSTTLYVTDKPTATASYADINTTTKTATGDNSIIVQGLSTLRVTLSNITANAYSSISTITLSISDKVVHSRAGSTGTVNIDLAATSAVVQSNVSTKTMVCAITDSRGNVFKKNLSIKFTPYAPPRVRATKHWTNGYYAPLLVTPDWTLSSVSGKNSVQSAKLSFSYDKFTTSYWWNYDGDNNGDVVRGREYTINPQRDNKALMLRLAITDKFGSTTIDVVVPQGMPVLFADFFNTSVGVNAMPDAEGQFKVMDMDGNIARLPLEVERLGGGAPTILANEDLNDYINIGQYRVSSTAVASSVQNIPIAKIGTLEVRASIMGNYLPTSSSKYLVQEYRTYDGERYERAIYPSSGGTTITAWDKYTRASEFDSVSTSVADLESRLGSSTLGDLNSYVDNGVYMAQNVTLNAPSTSFSTYMLIVAATANKSIIKQLCCGSTSNVWYTRYRRNNTWESWVQV